MKEIEAWRPKKEGERGFIPASEYRKIKTKRDWLIKDILLNDSLFVLFGPSETYKTFLGLEMLFCVAHGIPFFGHKVKKSPVAFVTGEGRGDLPFRIDALIKKYKVKDVENFYICDTPFELVYEDPSKELGKFIDSLPTKIGVLAIDTLNNNFGADENSSQAMGSFINNLKYSVGRGFAKIVIHHSGHNNASRARGSSALHAGVDTECNFQNKSGILSLKCTKMKIAAHFDDMYFSPEIISLSDNESSIILKEKQFIDVPALTPKDRFLEWIDEEIDCTEANARDKYADFGYSSRKSFNGTFLRMKKDCEIIVKNKKIFKNNSDRAGSQNHDF